MNNKTSQHKLNLTLIGLRSVLKYEMTDGSKQTCNDIVSKIMGMVAKTQYEVYKEKRDMVNYDISILLHFRNKCEMISFNDERLICPSKIKDNKEGFEVIKSTMNMACDGIRH